MPGALYIMLIPLLPMASFMLLGVFGRKYLNRISGIIGTSAMVASTVIAFSTAYQYFFIAGRSNGIYQKLIVFKYTWLQFTDTMSIDMGAVMDPITAMMLVVVT